jgi:hypothetical protein
MAAGAVAFAFFVLGGFVKTYWQLENLREESRREIQELRASLAALRGQPAAGPRPGGMSPLPPARRTYFPGRPIGSGGEARAAPETRPPPAEREGALAFRRLGDGTAAEAAASFQVISVSEKRLLVEGGRSAGFSEGMRLELSRNGRWIADSRIIEIFDSMSVCEILHATQPPLPGDSARPPIG